VKEEQRQALMGFCASLLQQRTPPPTQRMRVRARKEVIYSPTEIIAASNALKAAKEHEIALKQARKAEREMRKQQRAVQVQSHQKLGSKRRPSIVFGADVKENANPEFRCPPGEDAAEVNRDKLSITNNSVVIRVHGIG